MRAVVGALFGVALTFVGCSIGDPPAGTSNAALGDDSLCATQRGAKLLSSPTAKLVRELDRRHSLTADERKYLSAVTAVLLQARATGGLDPALLQTDFFQHTQDILREYPSFFSECDDTQCSHVASIRSAEVVVTCDTDCTPTVSEVSGTLSTFLDALSSMIPESQLIEILALGAKAVDGIKTAKELGQSAAQYVTKLMTDEQARYVAFTVAAAAITVGLPLAVAFATYYGITTIAALTDTIAIAIEGYGTATAVFSSLQELGKAGLAYERCVAAKKSLIDQGKCQLASLRVSIPCTGAADSVDCWVAGGVRSATAAAPMFSGSGPLAAHFRVRGVVEQRPYTGGGAFGAVWKDGSPLGGGYNVYELDISSPPQTFFLNPGSTAPSCVALDSVFTAAILPGATITLRADPMDGQEHMNKVGIVIPAIPPAPTAFDGQFVQVDLVAIVPPSP